MLVSLNRRKSLPSPAWERAADGVAAFRRVDPRHELTERVEVFGADSGPREGWALNASRGGIRVILFDGAVVVGEEVSVRVGADEGPRRHGRVVWLQEEQDGVVAGIEFVEV